MQNQSENHDFSVYEIEAKEVSQQNNFVHYKVQLSNILTQLNHKTNRKFDIEIAKLISILGMISDDDETSSLHFVDFSTELAKFYTDLFHKGHPKFFDKHFFTLNKWHYKFGIQFLIDHRVFDLTTQAIKNCCTLEDIQSSILKIGEIGSVDSLQEDKTISYTKTEIVESCKENHFNFFTSGKENIEETIAQAIFELTPVKIANVFEEAKEEFTNLRPSDLGVAIPLFVVSLVITFASGFNIPPFDPNVLGNNRKENAKDKLVGLSQIHGADLVTYKKFIESFLSGNGSKNLLSMKYIFCSHLTGIKVKTDREAERVVNLVIQNLHTTYELKDIQKIK